MNLHFLGRGAAFYTEEGNTSAYFIENKTLFLLDCGERVFSSLIKRDLLTDIREVYVLLSHLHCDHCGSLGTLALYCKYTLNIPLTLVLPHHSHYEAQVAALMQLFGCAQAYHVIYEEALDHCFQSFDTLRYELTVHDPSMFCFSFIFSCKQGDVFYSSDTRTNENVSRFIASHKQIDTIYIEVIDQLFPHPVHLFIDELETCIPDHIKPKVRIMHVRNRACMNTVQQRGFQVVKNE